MSRCFPFPPPGYEIARNDDDVELLAKEKHKERRHKKEKKDKEKREGKDKKDKERSNDKHREKKEKKEKRKDKKRDKDREEKNSTPDDRTVKGRGEGHNEEKPGESSFRAVDHMETKLTEELAKRIKDEPRPAGNQEFRETIAPVQRRIESVFSAPDQRRVETLGGRAVEKGIEQKEKKEGEDKRPERQRDGGGGRTTENKMGQNNGSTAQNAGHRRIEGKEKNKDKKRKEGDDRRGDRHEDKKREEKRGERVGKERDKEKEKKKDKVKEKREDRDKEWDKLKDSQKEKMNSTILKAPLPPQNSNDSEKNVDFEVNLKKRKDIQTNGFVYGNDSHPTKLPRLASSSQMPLENGRNLGQSHVAIRFSDSHGEANSRKGEIKKEHENGTIEVKPSTVIPRPPVPLDPPVNREASKNPPHPDSIYLSQLLSVPKMAEWPEFDDQEWLFSSNSLQSKPKATAGVTETVQVWAEAMRIESADVCALPYVIPY